ncbi:hypothetical protein ACT00Z_11225 [Bacillus stercoris]|uniref:hypothetical protein n=1 Tax=Bacillus subtilis group TaxID=653685 RepID=UPI0023678726|nr:hypothetical protein [Bacillus subtilis]MEC1273287.1 hypothetical protein [Bacillus subtilis]MEC1315985.1 hypothetical protein [Bacillus subtilis]MEC1496171.1 hypothetical protein [Bacillus subtilis]WDI23551.1 hypothetical protein PUW21_11055 [Bacillus subtilis]
MKKLFVLIFSVIFTLTAFVSSASAATTGSVTSSSGTSSKMITGAGMYMKFTCKYVGITEAYAGACQITRQGENVAVLNVGGGSLNKPFRSTDVWLNKNETYVLSSNFLTDSWSTGSITATISER